VLDAAGIAETASRLAALGCTAEQVARHLKHLNAHAARAAKSRPQRKSTDLTEDQIIALLPKLRERLWRWVYTCPAGDTGDWVGHAILSVVQAAPSRCRGEVATRIVGDALSQLRALGLVDKVRMTKKDGLGSLTFVRVIRGYRRSLHDDRDNGRDTAALTGMNGHAHGKLPNSHEIQQARL
jgi:hypothetical protein